MTKEKLVEAIANMRDQEAIQIAQQMLDAGVDPRVVLEAGHEAMAVVGERYERKEYYLPELVVAGEILKEIAELAKPKIRGEVATQGKPRGKVVIGTVEGDIHDIGKDIVAFMLEVNNYQVFDLGVDVPPSKFVEKIREVNPEIVGMSGFLTLAFDQMRLTVEAIKEAGLRDKVKIMIGGAPMDEDAARYVGADAYGEDAAAAVKLANQWTGGN
ncbi:MAG: methionine synthase [Ardenticatenia bacterium]|jgi:5-methyltetrahydrofolate--homocysteine methyltransferase|nr:MAG: methionine synthase [Ardenticatenia bacterium]